MEMSVNQEGESNQEMEMPVFGNLQHDNCETQKTDEQRNVFDRIGDFFYRMVKGIFIFAFLKLPRIIWRCLTCVEYLKFLLRYTKSVLRAIFWMVAWIAIVFAAWMAFGWEAFVKFWTAVGEIALDLLSMAWSFIYGNFGTIWMIIALIGSAYGLIYVSYRRRKQRRETVTDEVGSQGPQSNDTGSVTPNEDSEGPLRTADSRVRNNLSSTTGET